MLTLLALVTAPDPTSDPLGAYAQLKALWSAGAWPVVVLLAVHYLAEGLAFVGGKVQKVSWLAWLGKGRVSVVIAAVAAITTATLAAASDSASWGSVLGAALSSFLLWYHPAGIPRAPSPDVGKASP